ncbi:MAG TPA: carotenoid oxygenase family protein [Ilumatobacteraceae bacterium]|nr:carotenoid oxygenase family protein [Ilumatobacteraceae bacterium]
MASQTDPSIPPPNDLDPDLHRTIPPGLSGRLVGMDRDGIVHTVEARGGRLSYRGRRFHTDAVVHNLVALGDSILAFGDDAPAHELRTDVDTLRLVDLAGRGRSLAAYPKHDPATGELHLIARGLGGVQVYVVVSAGALTRRSRPIVGVPSRIMDLVLTRDRVAFVADGSVGVAARDGEARATWIATGADAPHPVHAHDAGDAVVLLVLTPSLERWTLQTGTRKFRREVLDPTPRRFAHCGATDVDWAPRTVWTTGGGTIGHHDLATSSHVHHSLRPHLPGDLVFVLDAANGGGTDIGWLVGFVHHASDSSAELRVIDAAAIAGPPVDAIPVPRRVPRDLRCTWIPATQH